MAKRPRESLHDRLVWLLRDDLELAIELAHRAANLVPLWKPDVQDNSSEIDLIRLDQPIPKALRPDLLMTIRDEKGVVKEVWILECQLSRDPQKRWIWEAYVAAVGLRYQAPVFLLVFSLDDKLRLWHFTDLTVGMGHVPVIPWIHHIPWIDDEQVACARPYAALFYAVHHAKNPHAFPVLRAAIAAARTLDPTRRYRYIAMVLQATDQAMHDQLRREFHNFDDEGLEVSEWERSGAGFLNGFEEGREEGREEGCARTLKRALLDVLALRGFPLDGETRTQIETCTDLTRLERWYDAAFRASSLAELFP